MNRRIVLKQLVLATAGAMVLPSCVGDPKKVSIALNKLQITGDEEELVAQIADMLIPATDTPGARAIGAHHFTFVMVDDCLPPEEQEKFLTGLRGFDAYCEKLGGTSFSDGNENERLKLGQAMEETKTEMPDEIRTFYGITKRFVLDGYRTSQHFLTNVKPYQLVPGPLFKGCVPVSTEAKA